VKQGLESKQNSRNAGGKNNKGGKKESKDQRAIDKKVSSRYILA